MMCACGMQAGIKKINKMNTEILGSVLQVVALVVLAYPLGRYIAKVYKGERTWSKNGCISCAVSTRRRR